jgi:competence protein ComEC
MSPGRFLLPALVAGLVSGILWADGGAEGPSAAVGGGILAALVLLACVLRGRRPAMLAVLAAVVVTGAGIGLWRGASLGPPSGSASVSALAGGQAALAGSLIEDPRPRGSRLQLLLDELVLLEDGAEVGPVHGRLLVWLPRGPSLEVGDRVRLAALIEEPRDFDGFAYVEYLARRGIGAIARPQTVEVVGRRTAPLIGITAAIRVHLLRGLNSLVPEPEAGIGAGIVLGARAGIAPDISEAFATAGLSHIVAISGFHIAIVAAVVSLAVKPLRRRRGGRFAAAAVTLAVIAWYVLMTGTRPSAVRAALMATALVVAQLSGSRAHAASALVLAAALMLFVAPGVLWDVGFQLSLLATGGIILAAVPIAERMAGWPPLVRGPVALTMAAQLTTLPVLLMNFERLSLVAPLANVLAVPLVPLAMGTTALAAVVGAGDAMLQLPILGDVTAWLAGGAAWLYLRCLIGVSVASAQLPFAALDVALPPWLAAAYYPALAIVFAARHERRPNGEPVAGALGGVAAMLHPAQLAALPAGAATRAPAPGRLADAARRIISPAGLGTGTVAALLAITIATLPDGRLHLRVLDIGQGDALLIVAPTGATAIVDGGPDPELTLRRLGETLPFHRRDIALVVLTHPHQDHVAGLVEIVDRFRVSLVLEADRHYTNAAYQRLVRDARQRGILATARAGQSIALDAATRLEILFPTEIDAALPLPDGDINNASVVALLRHGHFTALLTGDAEAPVERMLLDRGLLHPIDVLKVGHHGSHSSSTATFLAATDPAVAVMSLGVGNSYGHPSPATLTTLADRPGIAIYRTDEDGTVSIVSDGTTYRVQATGRPDASFVAGRSSALPAADAGSIGPWRFQTSSAPAPSCARTSCRRASSSTPRAFDAWRSRRREPSPRRRSRSTWASSRPPPCCTTSTSRRRATAPRMGSSRPPGSRRMATPSSPRRSPRTRSAAC